MATASVKPRLSAILVSFVYLRQFLAGRRKYLYRDWALDSGAFSAHNSGTDVRLADYMIFCHELMASDPTLKELFALDVINDWQASMKNTEEMWRRGIPAIPTYHSGEPKEALMEMARKYPKIALGGAVGMQLKAKNIWAEKCFAAVWPKKIHGLGFGSAESVRRLPFHSVDATNWEMNACAFGKYYAFGQASLSIRGSKQDLRGEVQFFLELEEEARSRWSKEMKLIGDPEAPVIRLAVRSTGRETKAFPLRGAA